MQKRQLVQQLRRRDRAQDEQKRLQLIKETVAGILLNLNCATVVTSYLNDPIELTSWEVFLTIAWTAIHKEIHKKMENWSLTNAVSCVLLRTTVPVK